MDPVERVAAGAGGRAPALLNSPTRLVVLCLGAALLGVAAGFAVGAALHGAATGPAALLAATAAGTLLGAGAGLLLLLRQRARSRRSTQFLRLAVETMDQGLIVVDAQDRVLLANRRAEELLGLPAGMLVPGRRGEEILDWQERQGEFGTTPEERRTFRRRAVDRDAARAIYRRTRRDGLVLEIRSVAGPDGLLVRTYANAGPTVQAEHDLADARDSAEAARALLAAAVENLPVGVLMTDAEDRILVISRRAVELLGVPADLAVPGTDARALQRWQLEHGRFAGDPAAEGRARLGAANLGVIPGVFERRLPEGRVLEVRSAALPGGGGISSFTDITARKEADVALATALQREADALRIGREQVERLHAALPAIVFLREAAADGASTLLYRAGDVESVTGWPTAEIGPRPSLQDLAAPETRRLEDHIRDVLEHGAATLDWRLRQPDGSWRSMRTYSRLLRRTDGGGGEVVGYILDVSAERQAKERADAALAVAVEEVPQGIILVDAADRIRVMNRRAIELLGLPPELCRPGADIRETIRWQIAAGAYDGAPDVLARARARLAGGAVPDAVFERPMPDGRVLEVRSVALAGGGGLRTYTDITERKRAETALAAARDAAATAEAALTATLENVSQGVLMVDAQGVVQVANRRVTELLGLPEGLCVPGRPLRDIYVWQAQRGEFSGDSRLRDLPPDAVLEFMLREAVYERLRPDGTWLEIRTRRLANGMLVRTFADVTQRQVALAELAAARDTSAAAEAALSATVENVGHGIMMLEADGTLRVVNRLALDLLGLPEDLARPGRNIADVFAWQVAQGEFAGQPDIERLGRATVRDFAHGPQLLERRRPDGRVIEIRTLPLPGGGAVRSFTDVTAAREAERALAAARDAAEAAARARSEFIAVMSHEIRTPLNGILGLSGMLLDATLPPEQERHVRLLRNSGEHLLSLVNDVLDISRFEAGRLDLEETPFDVREEIARALELASGRARAKDLLLASEVAAEVPARLVGDPGRLRQVLLNLLDNAVKFTEAGSVRVAVRLLGEQEGGVRLGIAVCDTGIGVPEQARAHVFADFTQADSSISRRYGGSGLGLAICRRLVGAMGGTLLLEDAPGGGSVFRFDVVLRDAPPEGAAPPPALPAAEHLRRLRVLLAEDNNTNRLVVSNMLERMGHRVDAVADGREALEAVQARPYDLVVMDMMMPEMDGVAATRAIRALPSPAAKLPVIGLTANADAAAAAACVAAGMNRHEAKPIDAARLAAAVAAVMVQERRAMPDG